MELLQHHTPNQHTANPPPLNHPPPDAFDWWSYYNITTEDVYGYKGAAGTCNGALLAATTASQVRACVWGVGVGVGWVGSWVGGKRRAAGRHHSQSGARLCVGGGWGGGKRWAATARCWLPPQPVRCALVCACVRGEVGARRGGGGAGGGGGPTGGGWLALPATHHPLTPPPPHTDPPPSPPTPHSHPSHPNNHPHTPTHRPRAGVAGPRPGLPGGANRG